MYKVTVPWSNKVCTEDSTVQKQRCCMQPAIDCTLQKVCVMLSTEDSRPQKSLILSTEGSIPHTCCLLSKLRIKL